MRSSIQFLSFAASFAFATGAGLFLTHASAARAPAQDAYAQMRKSIINFHVVDAPGVLRGGRPSDDALDALAVGHVKTVLDLQGGDRSGPGIPILGPLIGLFIPKIEKGESKKWLAREEMLVHAAGMAFVNKPLNSMKHFSKKEAKLVDEALQIMHDPEQQPVYVHCEHGNDRTGMVVALYRVRYDGMSPKDAHDEMVRLGHKGFVDHVVTHAVDSFFWKKAPEYQAEYQRANPR